MKKSTAIIGWALTVMFTFAAFGYGGLGIPLLLAAAVLVCPAFRTKIELPGKVWIPVVVALALVAPFVAPKQPDAQNDKQTPAVEAVSSAPAELSVEAEPELEPEPDAETSAPEPSSAIDSEASSQVHADASDGDAFPYHVTFYDHVNNDVTGNWRLAKISESTLTDIQNYAVSYYETYFKDDSEIHFIVNYALNTTTHFFCDSGQLFVTIYDHVDGEEHDAKVMPSGTPLASYIVTISDGSIEDVTGG